MKLRRNAMSHVDEGILAAWLDDQADAIGADAREIESHVAGCADCAALLERLRGERDRSRAILRGSAPPVAPPAFADLVARARTETARKRGRGMSRMASLAWAATMVLAVGIGWYATTRPVANEAEVSLARSARQDAPAIPAGSAEELRDNRAPARPASGAASGERRMADAVRSQPAAPPAAAPVAQDQVASALASEAGEKKENQADELGKLSEPTAVASVVPAAPQRQAFAKAAANVSDSISLAAATQRLGRAPLTVPGLPVLGYQPRGASGIVVIHALPNGVSVTLAQARHAEQDRLTREAVAARQRVIAGAAAKSLNEVAPEATRAVDGIDVTASAPVSAHSLQVLNRSGR
jgi:hypothetical protein